MEVDLKRCSQYLVADSKKRVLCLYEQGKLVKQFEDIHMGKNGVTSSKQEGDMCTPLGDFKLGFAFGMEELSISYPYYPITSSVYWVSDSNSSFYNQWVVVGEEQAFSYPYMKTASEILWNDAEHLITYTIPYQYGLVIEYNIDPTIPKKGSAIFLHVKNKGYTAGCVAISKEEMLFLLNWLHDKEARICIF